VNLSQQHHGFATTLRPLLAAGYTTLNTAKFHLRLVVQPRVRNFATIGQRCKGRQTNVDTYGSICLGQRYDRLKTAPACLTYRLSFGICHTSGHLIKWCRLTLSPEGDSPPPVSLSKLGRRKAASRETPAWSWPERWCLWPESHSSAVQLSRTAAACCHTRYNLNRDAQTCTSPIHTARQLPILCSPSYSGK